MVLLLELVCWVHHKNLFYVNLMFRQLISIILNRLINGWLTNFLTDLTKIKNVVKTSQQRLLMFIHQGTYKFNQCYFVQKASRMQNFMRFLATKDQIQLLFKCKLRTNAANFTNFSIELYLLISWCLLTFGETSLNGVVRNPIKLNVKDICYKK